MHNKHKEKYPKYCGIDNHTPQIAIKLANSVIPYDILLTKLESLQQMQKKVPPHLYARQIRQFLLGANELLLRQDESGQDFQLVISFLLDAAEQLNQCSDIS